MCVCIWYRFALYLSFSFFFVLAKKTKARRLSIIIFVSLQLVEIFKVLDVTTGEHFTTTTTNNNSNRIERRNLRFLRSPHCAANYLQHVHSSGQCAVVCKSRATLQALITCIMLFATWYEGTLFVCWLLNVQATCECVSGTDLLRQFHVLPH